MNKKVKSKIIKEFNKRFANGEQYLYIDPTGTIIETDKTYYWQERVTLNGILPLVEYFKSKYPAITETDLYGKNGLVDRLVPYQRIYNNLKNRKYELLTRICHPIVMVEDGSVDIDAIEEEGLNPGKVIVYRQGSTQPKLLEQSLTALDAIEKEEDRITTEMKIITDHFEKTFIYKGIRKGDIK